MIWAHKNAIIFYIILPKFLQRNSLQYVCVFCQFSTVSNYQIVPWGKIEKQEIDLTSLDPFFFAIKHAISISNIYEGVFTDV